MIKVIGVHTKVTNTVHTNTNKTAGASSIKSTFITDGHSWLSLHFDNGRSETAGLWLTDGEMIQFKRFFHLNPFVAAFVGEEVTYEVKLNKEDRLNYAPLYSRFYGLNDTRSKTARHFIFQPAAWRYGYTCATWVTEKMKQIFGQTLVTSELFGLTNTPRALGNVLRALEKRNPTSLKQPTYPV